MFFRVFHSAENSRLPTHPSTLIQVITVTRQTINSCKHRKRGASQKIAPDREHPCSNHPSPRLITLVLSAPTFAGAILEGSLRATALLLLVAVEEGGLASACPGGCGEHHAVLLAHTLPLLLVIVSVVAAVNLAAV